MIVHLHVLLVLASILVTLASDSDAQTIFRSSKKIFRTQSSVLHIGGPFFAGFNETHNQVQLKFEPQLDQNVDFVVRTAGDGVDLILVQNGAWRAEPGPLLLRAIDVVSDDTHDAENALKRFLPPDDGIQVAEVVADIIDDLDVRTDQTGDVLSIPYVYQSALHQSITLRGSGFSADLSLVLDPPLRLDVDYTLTVTSPSTAVLQLLPNAKWRSEPGRLYVRNIKYGDTAHHFHSGGVCLAVVVKDPATTPDEDDPVLRERAVVMRSQKNEQHDPFYATDDYMALGKAFDVWESTLIALRHEPAVVTRRALRSLTAGSTSVWLTMTAPRTLFIFLFLLVCLIALCSPPAGKQDGSKRTESQAHMEVV